MNASIRPSFIGHDRWFGSAVGLPRKAVFNGWLELYTREREREREGAGEGEGERHRHTDTERERETDRHIDSP